MFTGELEAVTSVMVLKLKLSNCFKSFLKQTRTQLIIYISRHVQRYITFLRFVIS